MAAASQQSVSEETVGATPRPTPPNGGFLAALATAVSGLFGRVGLTAWDWLFVFFGWLTLFWFLVISVTGYTGQDPGFDFMPVTAGIPILLMGWRAVHIGDRLVAAIRRLDDDAGLILPEGETVDSLRAELERRGRWLSYGGATLVGVTMTIGFSIALVSGNLRTESWQDLGMTFALGVVLIGVGAVLGYLLGRLAGYGQLFTVLERRAVSFTPAPSREVRGALHALEGVFRFSFWATVVLCHWFGAWFAEVSGIPCTGWRLTITRPWL